MTGGMCASMVHTHSPQSSGDDSATQIAESRLRCLHRRGLTEELAERVPRYFTQEPRRDPPTRESKGLTH